MKSRSITATLQKHTNSDLGRIIVLTGARQTGKTTLANLAFPHYKYLSIEDPNLRTQYAQLTANQWNEYYPYAILDEVQKEPRLIESIKSVYDQFAEPRYLLLGSSRLLLLQKVKESLAGRCMIVEVFPLTLPEIRTSTWDDTCQKSIFQQYIETQKISNLLPDFKLHPQFANRVKAFDYYLKYGGYPALLNESFDDNDRIEWLTNYIKTYLERDIRDLADFRTLEPFIKVQRIAASLTAQQINFTLLAKEADVSSNTANRFIQYLEISYQAFLLQPWYNNKLKRLAKTPKLHYLDPGIQKIIIGKTGDLTGNEFESAIVAEMYKQLKNIRFRGQMYHLRTHDGREIDLIIEIENGYIAIEIKKTTNVNLTDARHLLDLNDILDKQLIHSFIISNDTAIKQITENITAIPAALFLT